MWKILRQKSYFLQGKESQAFPPQVQLAEGLAHFTHLERMGGAQNTQKKSESIICAEVLHELKFI